MGDEDWTEWKNAGLEHEDHGRWQLAAACYQRAYDLFGRDPEGPGYASDLSTAAFLRDSAERCQAKWLERRRA